MARGRIPDPLHRRHLVERNLAAEKAQAIADAYLAEDRVVEALEFLVKAGAGEALRELRRRAVESGDLFLLRAAARAEGTPPAREEWQALAEAARALGKERYADDAGRQLESREED